MYSEYSPPAALAGVVECFWTNTSLVSAQRVMPDGATDIVLAYDGDEVVSATVVGTMTTALVAPPGRYAGVRFLPGAVLGVPASELTDSPAARPAIRLGGWCRTEDFRAHRAAASALATRAPGAA
jgi:hypothetical protein